MQGTELFLSLAEIAGVFVGFVALITVWGGGANGPHAVAYQGRALYLAAVGLGPFMGQ